MSHIGLAEVLGVKGKSIQWERPLFFFAALVISRAVWWVLGPAVVTRWETSTALSLSHVPPAWFWLTGALNDVLLAALALVAFRYIRITAIAVAVVAVVYSPLWGVTYSISFQGVRGSPLLWYGNGILPALLFLLPQAVWVSLFLGGLALALRWLRPTWLALLGGAVAAQIVNRFVVIIVALTKGQATLYVGREVRFISFYLLQMALFAGVIWLGIWLSPEHPSATGATPRLQKGFYVETLGVVFGLTLLYSVTMIILFVTRVWKVNDVVPGMILLGVVTLLVVYGTVVVCVLLYRMWAAIQDGRARTSPGRAVGYLFIPFYNFYWVFQAFPGFATDYNAFVGRHSLDAPRLSSGLFVAYAVLVVAAAIPWVGAIFTPAIYVILLILVTRICDAVNALPRTLPAAAPSPAV